MVLSGMAPWVTRMACETAAGSGVDALVDALVRGEPCARPAPWVWPDAPGLGVGAVAAARGGCGGRTGAAVADLAGDADALLRRVVDAVDPGRPCGLVVGTSSGVISGAYERDPAGLHDHRQRPADRLAAELARRWRGPVPALTVSVACASGAVAFDVARGWLRSGRCERVIVVGLDALSRFIHAGFAGLGALAAGPSRPFTPGRDGLMIGEAAAAVLLETPASARAAGRYAICALRGTGMSQDAVHLTAPDRSGGGLYRAAAAAVVDAGVPLDGVADGIDVVSAHGTGTVFNDAMESQALARLFGGAPVPLHAAKPVVGHTLGAAGTVEAVALIAMLAGAPLPEALAVDPALGLVGAPARRARGTGWGLSVNAAFGGVNAALVFGPPLETTAAAPAAVVRAVASADVTGDQFPIADLPRTRDGAAPLNLGRSDSYVRAGIVALDRVGAGPDDAVVLGSVEGCAQADRRYLDALERGGPERAPRVQFIYTVPGSPLAEGAILLGLTGPGLVLCAPPEHTHDEARRLVAEGRVRAAVALQVEAPDGPAVARATRYSA